MACKADVTDGERRGAVLDGEIWLSDLIFADGVVMTHVDQDDLMLFDDHLQGDPVAEGYGDRMQTGYFSGQRV